MQYRRYYLEGASYFFTVNLADRSSSLLIQEIETLRLAFKTVKQNHPFDIDAIVILPDHLHMLCTLPKDDAKYSKLIKLIKYYFSYHIAKTEHISPSRHNEPRYAWICETGSGLATFIISSICDRGSAGFRLGK